MTADNTAAPAGLATSTDPATAAAMQPPPAAPETSAMGAQPAAGVAPPATGAAPAAPGLAGAPATAGDGVAAPTELSRFLEESEATAAKKAADAATKGDAKKDTKKAAKS
jgi:hypothetical protein